ncbi:MAG: hypothetical protein KDB27_33535 [Planctomycetales bacterium]|nr:hypothetical protein [Planctomycetales bacterium]
MEIQMSIFNGIDGIVDQHLKLASIHSRSGKPLCYRHKEALLKMTESNLPNDGKALLTAMFGSMMATWGSNGCPGTNSDNGNWRRRVESRLGSGNSSSEVILERSIAQLFEKDSEKNWSNQVFIDSGLLGSRRAIDLAFSRCDCLEIIELKTDSQSGTPLSAAIQVLSYGLAHVFFRCFRTRLLRDHCSPELLEFKHLHLRVLAPFKYYDEYNKEINGCHPWQWLKRFEQSINNGFAAFADSFNEVDSKIVGFEFQSFPRSFIWDHSSPDTGALNDALAKRCSMSEAADL